MTATRTPPVKSVKKGNKTVGYPGKPITEIVTNGFFTVDYRWTVKSWNKAAETLLGVQANEILGKNLWEKFAGVIPLDFYNVYHKAFLEDVPGHFQEYWPEMGAWFDVITYHSEDTLSVSFKNSDQLRYINQNIAGEHSAQQLSVLNELYRFVTEVTNDCLWEWDLQTKEIFWIDGGHKRVFGYQIENALIPQRFWETRVHPEDLKRIMTSLNIIITTAKECIWEDEYRFRKADGKYVFVHDRGHILFDDNHIAIRMIGATQDISGRKIAEMHLLESEKKLSLIARQTGNAVIMIEADGKISWVNEAFTRITGYEALEVIGLPPSGFLQHPDADPPTIRLLEEQLNKKHSFEYQIISFNKVGQKYWMNVQGQPVVDENGKLQRFFVIGTDITEKILRQSKLIQARKNRQKEITEAVLTAQENERAAIGRELHDNLNQILGATKLFIEVAKTDEVNRQKYLDKSSDYLVTVIDEIRRISKSLVHPGMVMNLFESIKCLIDDLCLVVPINITFSHHEIDEEELNDKMQLTIFRIVQEQLNNIRKYAKATKATIQLTKQSNDVTLLITDNGVGCDLSRQKKGVGIINIRSRAELYGGTLKILSMPGEGFELKVVLPLFGTNRKPIRHQSLIFQ